MRYANIIILILFACVPAAGSEMKLTADQQRTLLGEAQELFDQGSMLTTKNPEKSHRCFSEAATKFQLVADSGVSSGWLYYDLANAQLKSGHLGLAIANYRRAEQYLGDNPQLEDNLDYARSLCTCKLPPAPSSWTAALGSLNSKFPVTVKLWIAIAAWCVLWLAWGGWLFIRKFRWRWVIIPAAVLFVLTTASVAYEWFMLSQYWHGVVTAKEVVIRKGNSTGYAPLYNEPVSEGVEFRILDKRRDWFEVKLPDGKVGWVPTNAVEEIKPKELW